MLRRLAVTSLAAAAAVALAAAPASAGCTTDYLSHSSPSGPLIAVVNNEIDALQAFLTCVW